MPASAGRRRGKRLSRDLAYRLELSWAADSGVPYSLMLGRPTPGPGEPAWLPEDRDRLLGLLFWRQSEEHKSAIDAAERCGRCGTKESDWIDDQGRRDFSRPDTFEAAATVCHGCVEVAAAWARIRGTEVEADAGVSVSLRPATDDPEDPLGGFVGVGAPHPRTPTPLNESALQDAGW